MENFWFVSLGLLLVGISLGGWCLTLVGLPGNWLITASAALYAWLGPPTGVGAIGWKAVLGLAILTALGELIETFTSVVGARRAGGSRRAALFSLLGSIVGAISGAAIGVPIPVLGSAIGSILGGAIGAFGGAVLAEQSRGEGNSKSIRVGRAAFWGRLLGTGAKSVIASINVVVVVVSLLT